MGLFGVASYAVAQRTNELGIRIALGARGWDVIRESLRDTLLAFGGGLIVGVAAAAAGMRLAAGMISDLLFGVTATDSLNIAAAGMLMIAVAIAACVVPARRAAKVDPLVAIRTDSHVSRLSPRVPVSVLDEHPPPPLDYHRSPMSDESSIQRTTGPRSSGGSGGRPDFVEFRNRLKRLVDTLLAVRSFPPTPFGGEREKLEVKLESEAVIVKFFVAELAWHVAGELIHRFQQSFAGLAPVFLDSSVSQSVKLTKPVEEKGGFGRVYNKDSSTISFDREILNAAYSVSIQTGLDALAHALEWAVCTRRNANSSLY